MTLSPFTIYTSWHHQQFMTPLPALTEPAFDKVLFLKTNFQVWPKENPDRTGDAKLIVTASNESYCFGGVVDLLRSHDAKFAALLTAWNPGRTETPEFNQAANARLESALTASGLPVYPARGTAESGDWYEDSFLVVGNHYDQFVAWQKEFEQLAFVLFRRDGTVSLQW